MTARVSWNSGVTGTAVGAARPAAGGTPLGGGPGSAAGATAITSIDSRERTAPSGFIANSNPTFELQIGFAGGLADPLTGLVRFGYRDYDPQGARWTARDPTVFGGGWNVYVYECENAICDPAVTRTLVEVPREMDVFARRDPEWRGGGKHGAQGDGNPTD